MVNCSGDSNTAVGYLSLLARNKERLELKFKPVWQEQSLCKAMGITHYDKQSNGALVGITTIYPFSLIIAMKCHGKLSH